MSSDGFWAANAAVLSPAVDRDIEVRSKQLFDTHSIAQVREWERKSQLEIAKKAEELRSLIGFFFLLSLFLPIPVSWCTFWLRLRLWL